MTTQDTPEETLRQQTLHTLNTYKWMGWDHTNHGLEHILAVAWSVVGPELERLRTELEDAQQHARNVAAQRDVEVKENARLEADRDLALWLHAEAKWLNGIHREQFAGAHRRIAELESAREVAYRERDAAVARLARVVEQREIAVSFARFVARNDISNSATVVRAARDALEKVADLDAPAAETPEPIPGPDIAVDQFGDPAPAGDPDEPFEAAVGSPGWTAAMQAVADLAADRMERADERGEDAVSDAYAWMRNSALCGVSDPDRAAREVFQPSAPAPEPTAEAEPRRLVTLEESAAKFGIDLDALDDEPDAPSEPPSGLDRDGDAPNELVCSTPSRHDDACRCLVSGIGPVAKDEPEPARAPRVFRAGDPQPVPLPKRLETKSGLKLAFGRTGYHIGDTFQPPMTWERALRFYGPLTEVVGEDR